MPEKIPTMVIATFCARGGLIDVGTRKEEKKESEKKNLKQIKE